jgi:ribonuclease HI
LKLKTSYAVKLEFECTNKIIEYEAIFLGLRKLKAMCVKRAILKSDSQVIMTHVDKSIKVKSPSLEKYLDMVRMESSFEWFSVKNIPMVDNEHVDMLTKSVAQGLPLPPEVFFEVMKAPSVEMIKRVVLVVFATHSED